MSDLFDPFDITDIFAFGSVLGAGESVITRYFTETASIGSMYYSVEPQTYPADFKIKFAIVSKSTGAEVILGQESSADNILYIDELNDLRIRLAAGDWSNFGSVSGLRNGTLQTGWLERINGVISAKLGEVSFPSTIASSDTFSFDVIGQRNSGLYFNGIIAELKAWKAGELVLDPDFAADFSKTSILENKAVALGGELWSHPPSTLNSWVDNGGGSYSIDGAQTVFVELTNGAILNIGEAYLIDVTFTEVSAGVCEIKSGSGHASVGENGSYTIAFVADGEYFRFNASPGFAGKASKILVRQAPGFGNTHNITESENYTLVDENWWNEFAPNITKESDSSAAFANQSTPTAPPVDNFAVAPDGTNTAWKFGSPTGGIAQRNIAIPTDYNHYTFSIHVKPTSSAGIVEADLLGVLDGGNWSGVFYTALTDTVHADWERVDLPDGWMRLILRKKLFNTGTGTLFLNRLISNVGSDEMLLWGAQAQLGTKVTAYKKTGSTVLGKIVQVAKTDIHTIGDSFATSTFSKNLVYKFIARGSNFTVDGIGGSTLAEQKLRFDLTSEYYDDVLVIMDGGLSDTAIEAKTAIDAMVASLSHDNWVWVQPSPSETIAGSASRIDWDAKVADIAAHVGSNHYIECLTALKAGNDGSANDLQDVANNIVPRSLRSDAIHETEEGTAIRTKSIQQFIARKGW